MTYTPAQAAARYNIPQWSEGYVEVNAVGHLAVKPTAAQPTSRTAKASAMNARVRGARLAGSDSLMGLPLLSILRPPPSITQSADSRRLV